MRPDSPKEQNHNYIQGKFSTLACPFFLARSELVERFPIRLLHLLVPATFQSLQSFLHSPVALSVFLFSLLVQSSRSGAVRFSEAARGGQREFEIDCYLLNLAA